jgi:hypothetical protein
MNSLMKMLEADFHEGQIMPQKSFTTAQTLAMSCALMSSYKEMMT